MARTYIELPSSGVVDMYDDIGMSFNYAIADIREPDKRDTTYSKTITIPGTKNNNKLFDHFFNVGKSGGFNPKVKAKAIVYVDTIPVFDGYLQLTNVTIDDKNSIEYEVVIFGKLANLYTEFADDELRDIDFSDLNHVYNKANIVASWTATIGQNYVYPLIDYGYTNGLYYDVENFRPAIYLKEYVDKIFTYAGFTYTSTFFNTDLFKRLIVPFNGTNLSLSLQQIANRTFKAQNTSAHNTTVPADGTLSSTSTVAFNSLLTSPNPAAQYNTGTYKWTVNASGTYILYFNCTTEIDVNNPTGSPISATVDIISRLRMKVLSISGGPASVVMTRNVTNGSGTQTFPATTTTTIQGLAMYNAVQVRLAAGDIVWVETDAILVSSVNGSLVLTNRIKSGSTFYNLPVATIVSNGETLDMNASVPDKIKIRDFMTSIIKAFNLYVEEDKNNANNLFIEPRNDFYSSGTTYDWTDKLDISRPFDIHPMGLLDARDYHFKYKEDTDKWNERYNKSFNKTYGDRLISSGSDFLTDTKDVELIFSPTPSVAVPWGSTSDRIIPQIINEDSSGLVSPKTSNIRLLYWGGLKNCTNGAWDFYDNGTKVAYTTYPYAGHLNDALNPTIDLSFGVPDQLFYLVNTYTNNNLYNVYWKKFIDEITDQESKLIIAYFYLNPLDMHKLDFRNKIFVDGHYYFINKIIDYNPTANEVTQVELIKIKEGVDFVSVSGVGGGGNGYGGVSYPFPFDESGGGFYPVNQQDGSVYNPQAGQTAKGKNNIIDAAAINTLVYGNNNFVGASSGVALINSDNNIIYPGLSNVTLINSSGVTVTSSNQTYVNGALQSSSYDTTRLTTQFNTSVSGVYPTTISGLRSYVEAGSTYFFRAVLHCTLDGTGGMSVGMYGDYTDSATMYQVKIYDLASAITQVNVGRHSSVFSFTGLVSTSAYCEIEGYTTVSASGYLSVTFAQFVTNGTSSILVGSTLTVKKIL